MRRGVDPFDSKAMLLSVVLHGAVFGVAWLSTFYRPPEVQFLTFEIDLVSPPPAAQAEEPAPQREELVVERPEPEPAPPEPEPEQPTLEPEREPEPEPPPPQPDPEPEPPEPDDEPAPAATIEPPPEEPPPTSGEGLNVRMEGLRRDYPQYYNNIIAQINRCLRWQGVSNWAAQVYFVIRADGTIRDLEFRSRSGNTAFDYAAMGAVECAGQGRFGPLPEDLPYESQPILFEFRPSGR
ncbi:MAG TPA: cell envelope integrity protein TolA [Longimicrobiales bacterium]|nr:cell envelope integrity protein TolA [Longimicrobiales bacterium]